MTTNTAKEELNILLYHKTGKKASSLSLSHRLKKSSAFTIVELLIVVVVIAILAAITIVSYNGITKSAKEIALKSDLRNAATQLELTRATTSSYPTSKDSLKFSKGTETAYSGGGNTFCLQVSNPSLPDKTFHITEAGSIEEGNCPEGGTTM